MSKIIQKFLSSEKNYFNLKVGTSKNYFKKSFFFGSETKEVQFNELSEKMHSSITISAWSFFDHFLHLCEGPFKYTIVVKLLQSLFLIVLESESNLT